MVAQYILAPDPLWSALKATGVPAANGYVFTYISGTRTYKATYLDPAGINPQTNPVRLNTAGEATIYWKIEDGAPLYTILVFSDSTVDGVPGQLLASANNYPSVGVSGGGSVITIYSNNDNFGRNAQFTWWTQGDSFTTDDLIAGDTGIADDWYFRRGNTDAIITITKQVFDPQTNPPPGTASNYLEYECTSAASDTVNMIYQTYTSVQTKANEEVTVGFWAKTRDVATTSTVSIAVQQYFGVGGTPTPPTVLYPQIIDDTWTYYSETFIVPPISGSTIGTGGDDYLLIGLQFQINQIVAIDIVDYAFQPELGTGINFPYLTQNDQYTNILPFILQGNFPEEGTDIIGVGSLLNPPQPAVALTEYLLNEAETSNVSEYLIGWFFKLNPNQFGASIPSVLNAQYVADQTIVLSDGDGVVSKNSFIGSPLVLTVLISGKKFGIFQIIESSSSSGIHSTQVSLGARLAPTSGTSTYKMAILGWNGATGLETKNAVSAWNAPGIDPSLSVNWNYVSTIYEFSVTASSSPPFQSLNQQEGGDYISYGVLIWNDSADLPIGISTEFLQASLTNGIIAKGNNDFEFGSVLNKCQRYYYRTYDWGDENGDGSITGIGQNGISIPAILDDIPIFPNTLTFAAANLQTSSSYEWILFNQTMYKSPAINIYNPVTGALGSGYLNVSSTNGPSSGTFDINASSYSSSETGFTLLTSFNSITYPQLTTVNSSPIFNFHYTADATLGV